MAKEQTESERLEAIFDAIGESICNESTEEILEDLRQEGIDPEEEALRLRRMMLDTLKGFQQRRMIAAREGYRRRVEQLEKRKYPIPESAHERRSLFTYVLQQSQYASLVTAQYRELKDLPDDDIEMYLEDLAELGVLDELNQADG